MEISGVADPQREAALSQVLDPHPPDDPLDSNLHDPQLQEGGNE
jgi:hypothetical protein